MVTRILHVLNDRSTGNARVSIQYLNATQSDSVRFGGIHLVRDVKDKRLNRYEVDEKDCKTER